MTLELHLTAKILKSADEASNVLGSVVAEILDRSRRDEAGSKRDGDDMDGGPRRRPAADQQRAGHQTFDTTQRYIRLAEKLRPAFGDPFPLLPPILAEPNRQAGSESPRETPKRPRMDRFSREICGRNRD